MDWISCLSALLFLAWVLEIPYWSLALGFIWLIISAKKQASVIASVPRGTSGITRRFGGVSSVGSSTGGDSCCAVGGVCVNGVMPTMMMTIVTAVEARNRAFLFLFTMFPLSNI